MTTYHIHISSRSNFASTTEQCAVMSSGGFPASVEIVAHQIDEIQISEIHKKVVVSKFDITMKLKCQRSWRSETIPNVTGI